MSAERNTHAYFHELDLFLQQHGTGSVDALQRSVKRFQFVGALSIPGIGVFEILVACLTTVVFPIPTLAVWMVLIASGLGLMVLRIVYSKVKRHRWAKLLEQWEDEHALGELAQSALETDEDPPRELSWYVRRTPSTTLDWCINYLSALTQTRDILLGAPAHAGEQVHTEQVYPGHV